MTAKWQFDNWQHNGASMWTQWQRIIKNNDNDISEEYLTKCTKMKTSEITCTLIYKPRLVLTFGAKLNATTTCHGSNCETPTKHLPSDQSLSKCLVHTWYTSRPEQSCGGSTATAFTHWSPHQWHWWMVHNDNESTDHWHWKMNTGCCLLTNMKALTPDTGKWTLALLTKTHKMTMSSLITADTDKWQWTLTLIQ